MKYKILLDMDGVIADFVTGIAHLHNKSHPYKEHSEHRWNLEDIWGISSYELWRDVKTEFWAELPQTSEAEALVKHITDTFGASSVTMLTSPSKVNTGACVQGKIHWMRWHFSQFAERMIFTQHKEMCASPNKILIDDNEDNVIKFIEAGGNAILVPRPWNSRHDMNPNVIFAELSEYMKR